MIKRTCVVLCALMIGSLAAASTAAAQLTNQQVVANVAFDFNVGSQILPAGRYSITLLNPASNRRTLVIRRLDGADAVIVQTHPTRTGAAENTRLVFHRYGNRYFLAQLWTATGEAGMQTEESAAERAAARQVVPGGRRVEIVALAVH